MTEKLSNEEILKCQWFDENYEDIKRRIAEACKRAGRDPKEVIMLAATKTVPAAVINHAIESGVDHIG